MKIKENKTLSCLGLITFILLVTILGMVISSWVFSILWGWFIVPVFDLPRIPWLQALGVILVVIFFRHPISKQVEQDWSEYMGQLFGYLVVTPLSFLGIGWLVLWFGGG